MTAAKTTDTVLPSEAPLARTLQTGVWSVFAFAIVLAIATVWAMAELKSQSKRLVQYEAVDQLREAFLLEINNADTRLNVDFLKQSLATLSAEISSIKRSNVDGQFTNEASALTTSASELLLEYADLRESIDTGRMQILQDLSGIYGQISIWVRRTRELEKELALVRSTRTEEKSDLTNRMTQLTEALVTVQAIRRDVEAGLRVGEARLSDAVSFRLSGDNISVLTASCEDVSTRCDLNPNRIINALKALENAPLEERFQSAKAAVVALQGYGRAAAFRFRELSETLQETILKEEEDNQDLVFLGELQQSINRTRAAQNGLQSAFDALPFATTTAELDDLASSARFNLVQLKQRGGWLIRALQSEQPGIGNWGQSLDLLEREWTVMMSAMREAHQANRSISKTFVDLSEVIAKTADSVRQSTNVWVTIFATTFLAAIAMALVIMISLAWLAKKHFSGPLIQVTRAIVRMAEGDVNTPLHISEGKGAFDRLSEAIERLRVGMVERNELAHRNAENLSALEGKSKEMEHQAMHDALTGLANRRNAQNHLTALTQSLHGQFDFCLMHVDIDHFKEINDTLGHAAGDIVLTQFAAILKEFCEPGARIFRIGGDEFLVSYPNGMTKNEITNVTDNILNKLKEPIRINGRNCVVGASFGVAFGRDTDFDGDATLVNADIALYDMKKNGRNGFRLFEPELLEKSRKRSSLTERVRCAVDNGAFVPFYQPQFYAGDLSLRGVETLCRWHDPELGWIPPPQFLDVAQEMSLVGQIDQIIFQKSADDLRLLHQAGINVPHISFNVTADRLLDPNLAKSLVDAFDPSTLVSVELLESMSLDNPSESVRWSIDTLKDAGIGIEIDDFGSSRASIAGLMAVRPDVMKIDQSIILPLTHNKINQELAHAIIKIGQSLSIDVVAEGVETQQHIEILKGLKCNILQGFGLAMPMARDDLRAMLLEETNEQKHANNA